MVIVQHPLPFCIEGHGCSGIILTASRAISRDPAYNNHKTGERGRLRESTLPVPVLLMARELGQGGTERQLAETAKALDPARFAVHVGCFHTGGFRAAELADHGIPILHLPVRSFKSPGAVAAAWTLGRYLKTHNIRLVHTFDTPMNCFAVPVARAFRTPAVLSSQRAARALSNRWERRILRWTDRVVDAVVVNCEAMRRQMIEEEGVPESRLRLCYNAIDTGRFRAGTRQRTPALAGASIVIGVVCALRPEKDLSTLLEAFAAVARKSSASPMLAVVGSGPALGDLRALARRLGVEEKCHFEPSTADVPAWLRAIDIFVLPSRSEALSNSLMEAMACGCAVIASRVGGNPELVSDESIGLLFEPGDTAGLTALLDRLMSDDSLRTSLGCAAARSIRDRFSTQKTAARMQEIYSEYLAP
jgi:glycosyltransferase involved in cell wall biosynthesis